ncbi:MAG TPA: CHAT domain-containing protein [Actinospica sp.]|nr:CHAT domain-containing protein [Actinospica sp.]
MTHPADVPGGSPTDGGLRLSRALELLEIVDGDAGAARDAVGELLADDGPDDEATAIALRVLGLSLRFTDNTEAVRVMRRAVELAWRLRLPVRAAQARTSLVVLLAHQGRTAEALREAAKAKTGLQGPAEELDLARLRVNLGLVLQRLGRNAEALECYAASEPVLLKHADARWQLMLCNLRGTLHAYQGRSQAAISDLGRAVSLAESLNQQILLGPLRQNLGFALLRSGRIPEALEQIALALNLAVAADRRPDSALADRADALLAAGLAAEALENAERAIAGQLEIGRAYDAAESRLMAARAALAADEVGRAAALAAEARAEFTGQRRHTWAAWAWQVELAARYAKGERSAELLRELTRCVARLERAGWLLTPQQARLLAARTAAAIGRRAQAERLYAQIGQERFAGISALRILAWEAESERRLLRGDRAGAGRAVTSGLGVLAEYAGTLGATDLRAGAASLGADLAKAGLRLSLESGSARRLLVRAEQWRAASLRRAPVRPAQSGLLQERLNRMRTVTTQITEGPLKGVNVRPLRKELIRIEEDIRELARHALGRQAVPESPLDLRALQAALDGRALVEYLRLDDELHAVVLADGRCSRHLIGSYSAVLTELESLRFAMSRIARRHGSPAMMLGAQAIYQHARGTLDRILLGPLRARIGGRDRELVLVPTGSLHALAWAALPSLEGRILTVSPSARNWLSAVQVQERPGPVALAHGPGLPHAEAEIRALAELYPDAKPLHGADASARTVAETWDGASLAHLAAHGRFRTDNPLFSNLELADGPLTVYDLESLGRAPRVLILSACDSALSGIRPGDELMGVASALLALGSKSLIASVAKVADEDSRVLMTELHRRLGQGLRPAHALAETQAAHPGAPAFLCLGSG